MPQFASAAFTGTQFTELSAVDANWSKQTGWANDLILGAGGTYVIRNSNLSAAVYRHSGSSINADYESSADIAVLNANAAFPLIGVCARMQAGAQTMYFLVWGESAGNIRLFKYVAGTQTQLGSSYTYTLTTTPARLAIRVEGSNISGKLNGTTVIGPVTDTDITAAGKAGIYLFDTRESGVSDAVSLDNFSADDLSAGTLSSLPPRSLAGRVAPYFHF